MSADALLSRLDGVRPAGESRWRARCPSCGGTNSSKLSIKEEGDGRTLVHCFGGCGIETIVAAAGIQIDDLFPPKSSDDHKPRIRRPWPARDVIRALRTELQVVWVIVADVTSGKTFSDADRQRAGIALERVAHFMAELDRAR